MHFANYEVRRKAMARLQSVLAWFGSWANDSVYALAASTYCAARMSLFPHCLLSVASRLRDKLSSLREGDEDGEVLRVSISGLAKVGSVSQLPV